MFLSNHSGLTYLLAKVGEIMGRRYRKDMDIKIVPYDRTPNPRNPYAQLTMKNGTGRLPSSMPGFVSGCMRRKIR